MGTTLTVATGYGLLIPLEVSERMIEKYEDGLYELLYDPKFNLLDYDMAYYHDYHPEDEPYEVIFVKSTVKTDYGVGVREREVTPGEVPNGAEFEQLFAVRDELGIKPEDSAFGYWTVVSVG